MTTERNVVQSLVRIVPSLFRLMRYVNDGRCLAVDKIPEGEKIRKEHRSHFELYQNEYPSLLTSSRSCGLLVISAL